MNSSSRISSNNCFADTRISRTHSHRHEDNFQSIHGNCTKKNIQSLINQSTMVCKCRSFSFPHTFLIHFLSLLETSEAPELLTRKCELNFGTAPSMSTFQTDVTTSESSYPTALNWYSNYWEVRRQFKQALKDTGQIKTKGYIKYLFSSFLIHPEINNPVCIKVIERLSVFVVRTHLVAG